jgi:hypothetical protein
VLTGLYEELRAELVDLPELQALLKASKSAKQTLETYAHDNYDDVSYEGDSASSDSEAHEGDSDSSGSDEFEGESDSDCADQLKDGDFVCVQLSTAPTKASSSLVRECCGSFMCWRDYVLARLCDDMPVCAGVVTRWWDVLA